MKAPLQAAARVVLLLALAGAPLALGRFSEWESAALLATVCVAALLWLAGGGALPSGRLGLADRLLLAGFALCAALSVFSVSVYDSLNALALLAAGLLALFLIRAALAEEPWNRAGWTALVVGAVIASMWGLREYNINALVLGDRTWRIFGPFYNPNVIGGYLALVLVVPAALALTAQTRKPAAAGKEVLAKPRKGAARKPSASRSVASPSEAEPPARLQEILLSFSGVLIAFALLGTGSKGAFAAAFVAVTTFGLLGAGRGTALSTVLRRGLVAAVLLGILAAVGFAPLRERLVQAFGYQSMSGSFRVYTWRSTLQMAVARPLTGFGPGTFTHAFPRFAHAGFTRQAHQTPLQLAAEHGIPAALLLLAGIFAAIGHLWRCAREAEGAPRLLRAAAVGGALGLWVHNLVDYTFYVAAVHLAFWGMLGLAWPLDAAGAPGRRRVGASALCTLLLLVAAALLFSQAQLAAARRYQAQGAFTAARESLTRVLPFDARRWADLSSICESEALGGDGSQWQPAIAARRRAAALQPTDPVHPVALARLLIASGDDNDARTALETALRLHPTSPIALAAMGDLQERTGDHTGALATYRRLADVYDSPVRTVQAVQYFVDEHYAFAFAPLAEDALQHGDRIQAFEYARRAVENAAAYLKNQEDFRQVLEAAGKYDTRQQERLVSVALRAVEVMGALDAPLAKVHVGAAQLALGRATEAATTLAPLARAQATDDAGRILTALARLKYWEALAKASDAAADSALGPAVEAGREVSGNLTGNSTAERAIWGWEASDVEMLRSALAAAQAKQAAGPGR
jgi:O-antigen ligase/tetratricopeptide (TPR) repeat protein